LEPAAWWARGLTSLLFPVTVTVGGFLAWNYMTTATCQGEEGRDSVFEFSSRGRFCADVVDSFGVVLVLAGAMFAALGSVMLWRRRWAACAVCYAAAVLLALGPLLYANSLAAIGN
jgi:hypothetical protein